MELDFGALNWMSVVTSVVAGQLVLTLWFYVFRKQWAQASGAEDPETYSNEIPGYSYVLGLICTAVLVIGLALLQRALEVQTLRESLEVGLFVAVCFSLATAMTGYAFLKRLSAFALALGGQVLLIVVASSVLISF